MKSKNPKIQNILMKGIAITMVTMFTATPMVFAANSSLDDSNISLWDKLIYGTVGSTAKEIEEYFEKCPVIYISNEIQLRALAEYVNSGNKCEGKRIYLSNDIELSQEDWVPIGKNGAEFNGTFDGNSHVIKGLHYSKDNKSAEELTDIGLFGQTKSNSIIRNLTVKEFNIDIKWEKDDITLEDTKTTKYMCAGNIVALNQGTIENCTNESSIKGAKYVGGIAGYSIGTIKNCTNKGTVIGYNAVGGIVGNAYQNPSQNTQKSNVNNCKNEGEVKGKFNLGGIAGAGTLAEITDCYNSAQISGTETSIEEFPVGQEPEEGVSVGGILGYSNKSTITNVTNRNTINGDRNVGGIVGYGENLTKIEKALNNQIATYINEQTETKDYTYIIGQSDCIGGIVGRLKNGEIHKSMNKMPIRGIRYVGGIAGRIHNSKLYNVYNVDSMDSAERKWYEVIGAEQVGGIVGRSENSSEIKLAGNTAEVLAVKNRVGGIVGNITYGITIDTVFATQDVKLDVKHWNYEKNGKATYYYPENPIKKLQYLTENVDTNNTDKIEETYCRGAGLIAGWISQHEEDTNNIKNCFITGSVEGMQYVGFAVGRINLAEINKNKTDEEKAEDEGNLKISNIYTDNAIGDISNTINYDGTTYTIKGKYDTVNNEHKLNWYYGNTKIDSINIDKDNNKITITFTKDNKTESKDVSIPKSVIEFLEQSGFDSALPKNKMYGQCDYVTKTNGNKPIGDDAEPGTGENKKEWYAVKSFYNYNFTDKTDENARKELQNHEQKTWGGINYVIFENLDTGYEFSVRRRIGNNIKIDLLNRILDKPYKVYDNANSTDKLNFGTITDNEKENITIGCSVDADKVGNVTTDGKITINESKYNAEYKLEKQKSGESNWTSITTEEYFTAGDTLKVTVEFDKYLAVSWGSNTELINAPKLTLFEANNKTKEISQTEQGKTTVNIESFDNNQKTRITYTYKVQESDNEFNVKKLQLTKSGMVYLKKSTTQPESVNGISHEINTNINIDTVAPIINTKVYVENALETGKYTTGKEVLIEVKTNEAIQVADGKIILPEIQVGFSKSRTGKYNYDEKNNKVGYAKPKSANIGADGVVTWVYSYQIQEGDEGDIQLEYKAGKIIDLAGNEADLTQYTQPIEGNVDGSTINLTSSITGNNVATNASETKNLTYRLYKGKDSSKVEIKGSTYIKNTDIITIEVEIPGFVYTQYGNGTEGNKATLLNVGTAPKLTIDNIQATATKVNHNKTIVSSIKQQNYDDVITTITYEITGNTFDYTNITKLNTMKMQPKQDIYISNRYVKEFAANGASTEELYDVGKFNEVVTKIGTTAPSMVDIGNLNIFIDPIGVADTFKGSIYADTTAPTVEIIAKDVEKAITNKDTITYEFTWSEELAKEEGRTFEESDITVNNGIKISDTFKKVQDGIYTIDVTPDIASGNIGDVQVIVEKGACQDLVGHENVRTEKIITVDKKAPTVEITADKDYVKVNDIITYTFNWSEAVKDFGVEVKAQEATESTPAVEAKAGIKVNNANVVENSFTKVNDSQYTLQVKPTNGNDVEVIINNGICTDIAGNANISNKHIIQVIPTLTISTNKSNPTNESKITYTFTWSEKVEGFTKEDIIVNEEATKGDLIDKGNNTFTITVNYDSIIPNGNEGEVTISVPENAVQDVNANGNAYTTNTTKIDRIAPILISLEAYGKSDITVDQNVDSVKQYYKAGDTVTVVATFSENVEKSTVPTLALQFSESGNAKGQVSTGETEGNKITYTYTITEDDMGLLSVKGFTGQVIDAAGNKTIVTKRNLDGDTIIADTVAPKLIGITAIAPDFEYDELLENPGDTKRYGAESKTREHNTITIIAEYSENIYNLTSNNINNITTGTAPALRLKFGTSAERRSTFSKIEGSKIYYTYDIASGDNGDLTITSLSGTVSDIAGNTVTTNTSLPKLMEYEVSIEEENKVDKITADTRKPVITISATAVDKDDNGNTITGNSSYYRKGSIITITTTTNEYVYKNTNKNLQLFTSATAPILNINFATNGDGNGTCTKVEYKNNQTIFTYQYEIKENDNGMLTVSIAENQGYDIALNGNESIKDQEISEIIADTVAPYIAANTNGVGKWEINSTSTSVTATGVFSEELYVMSENYELTKLTNPKDAPTMGVFANGELKGTAQASISNNNGKTTIVYTYDISKIDSDNISVNIIDKTLYDRAGNEWSLEVNADTASPKFYRVEVLTEDGYYKKDDTLEIAVKFYEVTKLTTAPTLTIKVGDKKIELTGQVDENDELNTAKIKVARYSYTIVDENGPLSIISLEGDASDGNRTNKIEKTLEGQDVLKKDGNVYDEKVIIDTTHPILTITSNVEKTNQNKVTYTFEWSEDVEEFTADDIEVINGLKGTFTKENNKVYTLEVDTTNEGRQIVKVNANVCTDIAGNPNAERTTYNKVVIDYTKPEIRAKVNGGNYVIDTDSKKSTLKETIVVNEEVLKFEYIWTKDETIPTTGFTEVNPDTIQVNSDIHLEAQVVESGTYYLYVKVTDKAGNVFEGRTNAFVVSNAQITLTPNITEKTNQDVTVTINYENGLTENRKAGVQGKTQSADATKVIAVENGTVYAEATDKAGNKVYATLEITNIDKTTKPDVPTPPVEEDKTAPEITFNYTTITATVGNAIGATITTNEDAMIEYRWDNQNWTSSQDFIRSINARRTPTSAGTYILYAKATDKASNTSNVSTLQFTVVNSEEEIKNPEIIFEDLTTIQKDGVKYVKVSSNYTTVMLTDKMDKDALLGKTPAYKNLTASKGLKTGSEITIDGSTKYIVIVNGDVNCDGKVEPIDVTMANSIRLNKAKVSEIQKMAADFDSSGDVQAIDITMINSYRLGKIRGI